MLCKFIWNYSQLKRASPFDRNMIFQNHAIYIEGERETERDRERDRDKKNNQFMNGYIKKTFLTLTKNKQVTIDIE